MVWCWVWWPVVVCWWCLSVSVSLLGRVVCFPVVGVVCCGALPPCVGFCCAVLSRGAVLLCSVVVLRCCWCLLFPPVACRAVLCCAVCWLCCFLAWWWCLRAVVLSSACCAFPVFSALRVAVPCCARCGSLLPCVVFCGAVLSRGAVACRAVMCCAVGWLCFPLPGVGVCVLWCSFPPCRHAQKKTLSIALCYPAPVSVSVVHVVGEVCLVVRCVIADPGHVVCEKVVLFVVVLACLQRNGGRTRRGRGTDGKGRYMEKKTKQEGASFEA